MSYSKAEKLKIVEYYRKTMCNVSRTISLYKKDNPKSGLNRPTFYRWLKEDKFFEKHIKEVEDELQDLAEHQLKNMAFVNNNMTALIFFLKNKHPEYKDKLDVRGNMSISEPVQVIEVKPVDFSNKKSADGKEEIRDVSDSQTT